MALSIAVAMFVVATDARAQTFEVVHALGGPEGTSPRTPLVQGPDGNFYGTTASGGANDFGTIFRLSSAGVVTVLHSFTSGVVGYSTAIPLSSAPTARYTARPNRAAPAVRARCIG